MKKIVTGILAHVDSGKTTLSEAMLYASGKIRSLGRVDRGDAFLDTHNIERARGITVFSKQATLSYGETDFTLLDTPGHVDFSAEAERTLSVLDYAILVINAADGVQSHTETLWRLLKSYRVPCFIFVNKTDIAFSSREELMLNIRSRLGTECVDFSDRTSSAFVDDITMCDDIIAEKYLSGEATTDSDIADSVRARNIVPCCFGSALKLDGVEYFMSVLDKFTLTPVSGAEFSAKIFKISDDEHGTSLAHMKITGGSLRVRDTVCISTAEGEKREKVNQIRIYSGSKYECTDEAVCGTVCAVTGLASAYSGAGLGAERDFGNSFLEPVMSYQAEILDDTDISVALACFEKLEREEPTLRVVFDERLREITLRLMGEIQIEVLTQLISERFGISIGFTHGSILYKETISAPVEGIGHYEPLRHYAEVHLLLEPLERGKGLELRCDCGEAVLDRNWQRLILTHLEEKTHIGTLIGAPVTDMRITLKSGRAHKKHTEGGDFRQATYRAVRQGLASAEKLLLEPWYDFVLRVPLGAVGRAMTDIDQMHGTVSAPETDGDFSVLRGSAPVSEIQAYAAEVVGYTRGVGRLSLSMSGYKPCHNTDEVVAAANYSFERDTENPADSVFCSHGAGYTVKWNEVSEHMHLESIMTAEKAACFDVAVQKKRAAEYVGSLASDKELMKIFERTYGPIKRRDTDSSPRVSKGTSPVFSPKTHIPKKPLKTEEYLLVDGYNIIFAWDNLKELAESSLEHARTELINILCNYRGFKQCNVILVFDAYKVKGNPGSVETFNNISIVYTKEAETADTYIERVTHELSRKARVRVATSDNMEQLIILGNGAFRISASAFFDEVSAVDSAIREYLGGL